MALPDGYWHPVKPVWVTETASLPALPARRDVYLPVYLVCYSLIPSDWSHVKEIRALVHLSQTCFTGAISLRIIRGNQFKAIESCGLAEIVSGDC